MTLKPLRAKITDVGNPIYPKPRTHIEDNLFKFELKINLAQ